MITSSGNSKIKQVRRLQSDRRYRWRERAFVVEGERGVRDAAAFHKLAFVLHAPDVMPPEVDAPSFVIEEGLMRQISDVETPSGILAVAPFPDLPVSPEASLLLILDGIQTPGNMGTMLRTAAAAGADGVLLAPGCVDPFNPKVVRGGMGAHWRIGVHKVRWDEIEERVDGMEVWVASAENAHTYTDIDWQKRSALIIGNEANGPSERAFRVARSVRIPMTAEVESLNAAMAAGVILFEAARQRGF